MANQACFLYFFLNLNRKKIVLKMSSFILVETDINVPINVLKNEKYVFQKES